MLKAREYLPVIISFIGLVSSCLTHAESNVTPWLLYLNYSKQFLLVQMWFWETCNNFNTWWNTSLRITFSILITISCDWMLQMTGSLVSAFHTFHTQACTHGSWNYMCRNSTENCYPSQLEDFQALVSLSLRKEKCLHFGVTVSDNSPYRHYNFSITYQLYLSANVCISMY